MAKNKKRKNDKEHKKENHTQLNGLLLVLVGLIGLGSYGLVGDLISAFAVFLVGNYYAWLLALVLVLGVYMFIAKKWPDFISPKLIGLYFIFLSVLVLAHVNYVTEEGIEFVSIIKETFNDVVPAFENMDTFKATDGAGAGILGGTISYLFIKLFDIEGSRLITIAFGVLGFALITGISIVDLVKAIISKVKSGGEKLRAKDKAEIEKVEKEFEEENKIVISSLDELSHISEKMPEHKKEDKVVREPSGSYRLPPMDLLEYSKKENKDHNREEIDKKASNIVRVLKDFGIDGKVTEVHVGPSVTQYEIELRSGTKVSKVTSIHREIALALAAKNVRIEAPIPGKNTIGIEFPNDKPSIVTLRDILKDFPPLKEKRPLLAALGKNIMGVPKYVEINSAPHLLVAGATGSGKSVCINSIIISILMRTRPDEVKFLLIDPKQVELSIYNGVPHLLRPVVTKPKEAAMGLKKVVSEMERRYDMFNKSKTKNIAGYNKYVEAHNRNSSDKLEKIPYIVVIVDELSDLMIVAAKEVEDSIIRITQLARAAGIHLIIATQRPSTDVITGLIKANLPSRISFAVASSIDSRTILDKTGAEKLLGKGDMLFLPMGENAPLRLQGAFVSDSEIKKVIDFVSNQQKADYDDSYMKLNTEEKTHNTQHEQYEDPIYDEIVEFIISGGKASASLIQRRFRFGYNRAARIIDQLEERGIIGPANGSKPREVLVKLDEKED